MVPIRHCQIYFTSTTIIVSHIYIQLHGNTWKLSMVWFLVIYPVMQSLIHEPNPKIREFMHIKLLWKVKPTENIL